MKKTRIIIISLIIFLCVIAVAVAIIFQMTENDYKKAANKEQSTADDIELIKNNFNNIFNNDITGNYENVQKEDENKAVVYTTAEKEETIPNKYDLDVQIPKINIDNEITKKWNSEIKSTFQNKAANILSNTEKYTVYKVKYHTYINNNILSLIVKANLKEGGNPERVIIKTYNYDLEKNAEVSLNDIISNKQLKKEDIENKIKEEIKNKKDYENTLIQLGYETYNRNSNDDMYKTENINNFILGENGRLYIIFAYGNKTYTSETDMIIIE